MEMGFERASMDEVARHAHTSKRSLYAHFENKEKLFLAVINMVRSQFLAGLGSPGDYSTKPVEALTLFCARYLEFAFYVGGIRMCRMIMAEAERFPLGAAQWFDVIYTQVHARLAAYLQKTFPLNSRQSAQAAEWMLGRVLFPRFIRTLFGVDHPYPRIDPSAPTPTIDVRPVRRAVQDVLDSLRLTSENIVGAAPKVRAVKGN